MRQKRYPKETDDEEIEKAIRLLEELVELNSNIEMTLWYSAFHFAIAKGFKNTGYSYKEYVHESNKAIDTYIWVFNKT